MATKEDVSLRNGQIYMDAYAISWPEPRAVRIIKNILPHLGCMALDDLAKAVAVLQAQQGKQEADKP